MSDDTMTTTFRKDRTCSIQYMGETIECRNNFVARCVGAIAYENLPDAEWANNVLNTYGHLVKHPAEV